MKGLLKILVFGFAAFMLIAVAQEWDFFSSAWFGGSERVESPVYSESDQKDAADTVYLVLSLMRHLYSSGGDPRFAERMPVSDGIVEEMMADIAYLRRNHRRQDPELVSMDVTSVETAGNDRLEIRTRELWQVRFYWAGGDEESQEPHVQAIHGRYLLLRGPRGWLVEGWGFVEPDRPKDEAGA